MSLFASIALAAQPARPPHPGELALGLRRLGATGAVLYVAAHPDDENTRLLAWLSGAVGVRTGYLSMTRGEGGQNLIGSEQGELLGVIRTHELLAARRIDGAEQFFTSARDLGYSKNPEETFAAWNKDRVLRDVVRVIRSFKPDVVITRFNTRPPNHGHHTASAILAEEAFALAAEPGFAPELGPAWKVDRLLHNVSTWNAKPGEDYSKYLKLDVGGYEPLLGRSWGELAAESRSQHKSQGFGVAAERGPLPEYFAPVAGTSPKAPLDGLEWSWKRFSGADALAGKLAEAQKGFSLAAPHQSISALLEVRKLLAALPDGNPYKALKLREADALLAGCAGLYLEARAKEPTAPPGGTVKLELLALNRSAAKVALKSVAVPGAAPVPGGALAQHAPFKAAAEAMVPADAAISTPFWLRAQPLAGAPPPEAPVAAPALRARFELELHGQPLAVEVPVTYGWTDPVRGELWRDFEVAPEVTATLAEEVMIFPNGEPRSVSVVVAAGAAGAKGTLKLELPEGWKAEPAEAPFTLAARGDELAVTFKLAPPKGLKAARGKVEAVVHGAGGARSSWRQRTASHGHLPPLTVRDASVGALVVFPLERKVKRVGYVPGPGDKVAESLAAAGYEVTLLPDERLGAEALERYEAIVVGVRAFNANPRLAQHRDRLLKYVEQGGRLVVQYNTNSRIGPLNASLGPFPLEIGRDRVTDEGAALTAVDPKDKLLLSPNALAAADYEGWVQERGLYFASKWDPKYRAVFRLSDPGEPPLEGGLLVAKHGRGRFIYTGLSFFRQLPAGVPGAYRLFANLLAP